MLGISDGAEGVQWNASVDWTPETPTGFAGVNLEGKEYQDWPVGRFIQRELERPRLMQIIPEVTNPAAIHRGICELDWSLPNQTLFRLIGLGDSTKSDDS